MKRVKAILLAAGLGSRLRPLTLKTPKCLVPINGRPLLSYWLDALLKAKIESAIINTHWLSEEVDKFLEDYKKVARFPIRASYERVLLGTAGTIAKHSEWAADSDATLVIYADNYAKINLIDVVNSHFQSGASATLGVFPAEDLRKCGVVEIDRQFKVLSFEEKPEKPKGTLAAAGIYIFAPEIIREISRIGERRCDEVFDLGFHVFPYLASQLQAYLLPVPLVDIGSPDAYAAVCAGKEDKS